MIVSVNPCNFQTFHRYSLASPSDDNSALHGMKCDLFECRQQTTSIESCPWLIGNPVIRSADTCFHGSSAIGLGISFPSGAAGNVLVRLQWSHPFTYSVTNLVSPGHQ